MTQTIDKIKLEKTVAWVNEQTKGAEVALTTYTPEQLVDLHRAFLRQLAAMYDNPEMKRTIGNAMRGDWNSVFYDKYKPEILQQK